MDDERADFLKKAKLKTDKKKANEVVIEHVLQEQFVASLQKEIQALGKELNRGVENNKIDIAKVTQHIESLVNQLTLRTEIERLITAIASINVPIQDKVEVSNLNLISKAIEQIKPQVKIIKQEDIYATYKPANSDDVREGEKYYGFVNSEEGWFILQESGQDSKTWKYAAGRSNYRQAWNQRRKHEYGYYYEVSL